MVTAQEDAAPGDAAGILVIAWGILLSGIPKELAFWPRVGWLAIVAAVLLAIAITRKTTRNGVWHKKAREE